MERWRVAYDAAGIVPTPAPPADLVAIAAASAHIVASDLRRAIESAKMLAPDREVRVEPLIREAPMPIPRWPTPLPLAVWGTVMYARWSYSRLRGRDIASPDWQRAEAAGRVLTDLVSDGSTAVVVTHGIFRKLLATHLTLLDWSAVARKGGYSHWSAWDFTRGPGAGR